ncbi:50S ribosomal protein L4 [Acidianus sp. HS-5]|uniref:50S ribosomal protein L4 n=1 Tax=Acidianus sp. HS-5 TaxID=2886040 RepID=UPI001F3FFF48|nr:50S ribosomal protein L4 [Acidianus sp. HS-5]BDC19330.1 50S ribosomal protein L4 [Acidianus sp. HS-5]
MYIQLQQKKADVIDLEGKKSKEIDLPLIFSYPVRKDIINRAFRSSFTKSLQPKGRDPMAGKRTTAKSFGINLGLARVPRIKGSGEAALAPNTVGGRLVFPPSPMERIVEDINKREMRLAIISAISATTFKDLVKNRGHKIPENLSLPIIVSDDLEKISKSKDIIEFIKKLGLEDELERCKVKKIRSGKGKMRGRRYKTPKGPLFVIKDGKSAVISAIRNIQGFDVITAKELSVIHLAPGGHPGRLTIFTEGALQALNDRFGGEVK